jgi:hypothetical protein
MEPGRGIVPLKILGVRELGGATSKKLDPLERESGGRAAVSSIRVRAAA